MTILLVDKPANSIIGGASLWVMAGRPDAKNITVSLNSLPIFLVLKYKADWHQAASYLPV